jgi:hypothetical protein
MLMTFSRRVEYCVVPLILFHISIKHLLSTESRENGLRVRIKSETSVRPPRIIQHVQHRWSSTKTTREMNARFPWKKNSFRLCVIMFIKNDPLIYNFTGLSLCPIHKLLWHSKSSWARILNFFSRILHTRKYLWLRLKFVRNASCW